MITKLKHTKMERNLDLDIIKEFIPIEDKSSFLVFESINVRGDLIFAPYRMSKQIVSEGMVIPLSSYLSRKREKKLKQIGIL
jgi:hypothetical protein